VGEFDLAIRVEDAKRITLAFEQAQDRARSVAAGYRGTIRIALTDGIDQARLATLLALSREEAPEVCIRLFETPLAHLVNGLNSDLFDAGLALNKEAGSEIVATPVWHDPLVVALPARHPLLAFKQVPLCEAINHPLVLCHPDICEGCSRQIGGLLRSVTTEPRVAEYVNTHTLMMTLVAAGYGAGFSSAGHLVSCRRADVVVRPLADERAFLTTYVLRPAGEATASLLQFIERAERIGREP
jgi:DNA-binding transcriptional LysR family regulator